MFDEFLCVVVVTDDPLGEFAMVVGVEFVESFEDEFCVVFVLGEDDGFSKAVAACYFDASFHEVL